MATSIRMHRSLPNTQTRRGGAGDSRADRKGLSYGTSAIASRRAHALALCDAGSLPDHAQSRTRVQAARAYGRQHRLILDWRSWTPAILLSMRFTRQEKKFPQTVGKTTT